MKKIKKKKLKKLKKIQKIYFLGIVVGIEGHELETGEFNVEQIYFPEMAPQNKIHCKKKKKKN